MGDKEAEEEDHEGIAGSPSELRATCVSETWISGATNPGTRAARALRVEVQVDSGLAPEPTAPSPPRLQHARQRDLAPPASSLSGQLPDL